MNKQLIHNFISYCQSHIKGDEKGEAHIFLDFFFVALGCEAVIKAYSFSNDKDILEQLLELNLSLATKEENREKVHPPDLPDWVEDNEEFVSEDCVRFEWGEDGS